MEITISIVNGTLKIYCHKYKLFKYNIKKIFLWEINTILLMNLGHHCSLIRTHAGLREVANSSRRVLGSMQGNKGAKYGYTRAAGFSSVVYVERRGKKVVAVVLGERSTAQLYKRMAQLVDQGFTELN